MRSVEELLSDVETRLRPLEVEVAEAWWESNTRSSDAAEERRTRAELALRELLADPELFAEIRARRSEGGHDPLVARRLDVLHDGFVAHQVPPDLRRALVELETKVESTFNNFRGTVDGRRVDDNDIAEILRTSDDSDDRRKAWEAAKSIGLEVVDDVRELARLRNEAARALGFRDHFALALATSALDETRLFATLDEVDRLTETPFDRWKKELDSRLATRFGVDRDALAPWHLDDPFFQDPPVEGAVDLDPFFADTDLEALTRRTYGGLDLDVDAVLEASDLYAREGKNQHAFCIHIDREGDVRVLCNLEP